MNLSPEEKLLYEILTGSEEDSVCPSVPEILPLLKNGWPPAVASHVKEGCARCRKRIGTYWTVQGLDQNLLPRYLKTLDPADYWRALVKARPVRLGFLESVSAELMRWFNAPAIAFNKAAPTDSFERPFSDAGGLKFDFRREENETLQVLVTHPQSHLDGCIVGLKLTADRLGREVSIPLRWLDDVCLGVGVLGTFAEFVGAENLAVELSLQTPPESGGAE